MLRYKKKICLLIVISMFLSIPSRAMAFIPAVPVAIGNAISWMSTIEKIIDKFKNLGNVDKSNKSDAKATEDTLIECKELLVGNLNALTIMLQLMIYNTVGIQGEELRKLFEMRDSLIEHQNIVKEKSVQYSSFREQLQDELDMISSRSVHWMPNPKVEENAKIIDFDENAKTAIRDLYAVNDIIRQLREDMGEYANMDYGEILDSMIKSKNKAITSSLYDRGFDLNEIGEDEALFKIVQNFALGANGHNEMIFATNLYLSFLAGESLKARKQNMAHAQAVEMALQLDISRESVKQIRHERIASGLTDIYKAVQELVDLNLEKYNAANFSIVF